MIVAFELSPRPVTIVMPRSAMSPEPELALAPLPEGPWVVVPAFDADRARREHGDEREGEDGGRAAPGGAGHGIAPGGPGGTGGVSLGHRPAPGPGGRPDGADEFRRGTWAVVTRGERRRKPPVG